MKARTIVELDAVNRGDWPGGKIPVGTVLDDPAAYRLVRHGCAVPDDEACAKAADVPLDDASVARRLNAYQKIAAGITPEDREAWDRGWMRGYNPDGTWKPGPNAAEYDDMEYEEYKRSSPLVLPG